MLLVVLVGAIVITLALVLRSEEVWLNLAIGVVKDLVLLAELMQLASVIDGKLFLCLVSVVFRCRRYWQRRYRLMLLHELRLYHRPLPGGAPLRSRLRPTSCRNSR